MSSLSICILAELHYVWKAGTYKNYHFYLHDVKLQKSGLVAVTEYFGTMSTSFWTEKIMDVLK